MASWFKGIPVRCVLVCTLAVYLSACSEGETHFPDSQDVRSASSQFDWGLAESIPLPFVPEQNPMSETKFQLGRHLFYDQRLSGNGTQACASCHRQDLAFTDGLTKSVGSTGEIHPRSAQSLVNTAYHSTLTWANPSLVTLEQQILLPLFGEQPVEHGLNDSNRETVLDLIREDETYQALFDQAYPDLGDAIQWQSIVHALATFTRGIVSFESAFDRFENGDQSALSEPAKRGRDLFFSEALECFHCHGGYLFSDSVRDATMFFIEKPFHNNGLFNIGGTGAYPDDNQGIFEITADPSDMGKFRTPTLRNIELTAPYMHDGSLETLSDVIDFYADGGRNIPSGEHAGDGRLNPFKDGFINGFSISESEKADLIAFLNSLTDQKLVTNPRFENPWEAQ